MRAGDIVLGRILGFTIVGTVLLAIMGVCQLRVRVRTLDHTHAVEVDTLGERLRRRRQGRSARRAARRSTQYHRHEVEINPDGTGLAAVDQRARARHHRTDERGGETVYAVSGPRGMLRARVPEYGKLRFLDRKGVDVAKGISVGSEWTYRSFIEGGTPAAAIWTFSGINESMLRERGRRRSACRWS